VDDFKDRRDDVEGMSGRGFNVIPGHGNPLVKIGVYEDLAGVLQIFYFT